MFRGILALLIFVVPLLTMLAASGCEQEIKSVHKTERIEESQPQMTSPG